jgi:hypothetical protein
MVAVAVVMVVAGALLQVLEADFRHCPLLLHKAWVAVQSGETGEAASGRTDGPRVPIGVPIGEAGTATPTTTATG